MMPFGETTRNSFMCIMWLYIGMMLVYAVVLMCMMSYSSTLDNENDKKLLKDLEHLEKTGALQSVSVPREKSNTGHKLAIIIPFRDRFDELLMFVPHMNRFLERQHLDYDFFVMNQADGYRFNRASLINVGFLYVMEDYDYIAMHDVDLLPLNPELSYSYPEEGPYHVASPQYHPRYNYSTFVGGILLINRDHFQSVNGMSNRYWGWGLEDDEFYLRLKEAKLSVSRPTNLKSDRSNTLKHIHDRVHRKRDTQKCFNQYEATRKRDRRTGLHDVDYEIKSETRLTVDGVRVTVVSVALHCDKNSTPWCDCQDARKPK